MTSKVGLWLHIKHRGTNTQYTYTTNTHPGELAWLLKAWKNCLLLYQWLQWESWSCTLAPTPTMCTWDLALTLTWGRRSGGGPEWPTHLPPRPTARALSWSTSASTQAMTYGNTWREELCGIFPGSAWLGATAGYLREVAVRGHYWCCTRNQWPWTKPTTISINICKRNSLGVRVYCMTRHSSQRL